jgi:hypothetical protein
MKNSESARMLFLGLLVLVLWGAYFVICGAPVGATFIYADF